MLPFRPSDGKAKPPSCGDDQSQPTTPFWGHPFSKTPSSRPLGVRRSEIALIPLGWSDGLAK